MKDYSKTKDYISYLIRQGRQSIYDITPEEKNALVIEYALEFNRSRGDTLVPRDIETDIAKFLSPASNMLQFRKDLRDIIFSAHKHELTRLFEITRKDISSDFFPSSYMLGDGYHEAPTRAFRRSIT